MLVKQRLQLNAVFSIIAAAAVLLVLFLAVQRIGKAFEASDIADRIVTSAFERLALRNDYMQNGSERAKGQWFARHQEVGRLLAAAAEKFRGPAEQKAVAQMIADHESAGRIFSELVKNREKARDPAHMHLDGLLLENEERFLTQLNTRVYELVLQARGLQESGRESLFSTLRLSGLAIACVFVLAMAVVIVNSWTMGRLITKKIQRLCDGTAVIGEGNLDHRIAVRGRDELAELSEAFNAMSAKLQESYRDLESEVAERARAQEATRELNEALTAKNIQLESANREMESFIYSVSHDLRQPLRAIGSFSQLAQKGLPGEPYEKEQGYLRRVIENAAKMSDLIEDLLKLSRISRQELQREPIELTRLAEAVVAGLREGSPARVVEVTIGKGMRAIADRGLMTAVLENLLGNAWKFTSRTEGASIEFGALERNKRLVYFVRDNGVGFDPQYAKNMFKPFHRLHSESDFEGTGIGLSIVERIIGRHGGDVWAEGDIGEGATVFFTLPPPPPCHTL
ncbi:MAG: ATP-binding protein [Deltaproteobacteria bacterium]|nr:ATP-binding protein [Deltaproteobacteria bacterium]